MGRQVLDVVVPCVCLSGGPAPWLGAVLGGVEQHTLGGVQHCTRSPVAWLWPSWLPAQYICSSAGLPYPYLPIQSHQGHSVLSLCRPPPPPPPPGVAHTRWGDTQLGGHPGPVLHQLAAEAQARLREFNSQNIANSIWALANLGERPDDAFMAQVGGGEGRAWQGKAGVLLCCCARLCC